MEGKALRHRQAAPGLPVVLSEREEGDVRLEEVERVLPLLVQLDLELHRVGLQVHQAVGLVVLRPRLGPAVEGCRGQHCVLELVVLPAAERALGQEPLA